MRRRARVNPIVTLLVAVFGVGCGVTLFLAALAFAGLAVLGASIPGKPAGVEHRTHEPRR